MRGFSLRTWSEPTTHAHSAITRLSPNSYRVSDLTRGGCTKGARDGVACLIQLLCCRSQTRADEMWLEICSCDAWNREVVATNTGLPEVGISCLRFFHR